ncbi:MAG: mechanosensitive ion channel family protein [Gammaproteobacteria bacterium]|nr:mechanosensitive ion channel family protein [Gammaproteobacteria bacterium]MCW8911413.1 mechanosensitive ion channel family protein [Gammaproteobacteria bacterium]MCW9003986.1 mechanosensitive ion channel family protein [Gammaproteobacteria bacterium]MCW9055694.1 mechanosensitive ion channel family protein [Gammaproteobacteria bacterium]
MNLFNSEYAWVSQVFIIVFGSLVLDFMQKHLINKLHKKLEQTKNAWDDLFIISAKKPLTYMIWLMGFTLAAEIVQKQSDAAIFSIITSVREIGVIVIIMIFLLSIVKGAQDIFIEHENETGEKDFDKHTVEAISKLFRASIIITSSLVMLQTLGYSISGVLAFGGIGGVAVGFAAKDMLANFFGGLMIYLERPFKIGDWIRSNDRDIEGTVEHIGWRLTRIRTFDKRPLYVPNSVFSNIAVENPSRMTNRRIYETIGIRYDDADKMQKITAEVKQMLLSHPEIDSQQTLIVNFNKFASSSVDFFVYTFTKTTEWVKFHEIKQEILLNIMGIIEKNDAQIAFPTSTLHVQTMPEVTAPEIN